MGSSSPSTVTQRNKVELSPEQQQIFEMGFGPLQSWASKPLQLFPGTGIAGFNPLETSGQEYATNVAAPAGGALAGQAAGAQGFMLDPSKMLAPNQYVTAAADALTGSTTRNLMENILPGIRSGAISSGGMYTGGPSRQGIAEGLAIGRTNEGLSHALADMYFKNYTAGLGAMSSAVAQNPSVIQSQLFPASVMSSVGAQQRALSQAQLDEEIRKFYGAQNLDLSKAQTLLGMIPGIPGATGTSTVTGAQPQSNPWMQGLGIGLTVLGSMYGMPWLGAAAGAGMGAAGSSGMGMGK